VEVAWRKRGRRALVRAGARGAGFVRSGAWAIVLGTASLPVLGQAPGISWESAVEVAAGDAHRGPWRMNQSEFLYVDDPSVAMDAAGGIGVVWVDQAEQDIYFQYYDVNGRARLERPVNVSRSGDTFSWLPRLVVAGENSSEVGVLWQEIVFSGGSHGGEIFFARSADGGRSYSSPVNLSRTTAGAGKGRLHRQYWHNGSLDLVRSPSGELYAAWTEYEGPLHFSRSTDGGRSFSEPVLLAGGDGELPARGPALALDGNDRIYLAWAVGEDPGADIHLAWSADGGNSFVEPRTVGTGPGHADAPRLVVSDGHLHLVYAESAEGPLQRYEIRHARARLADDGSPQFQAPRTIAGGQGHESVGFPGLDIDGDGTLYLLWERFPDPGGRPRGLGYAISRDDGRSFSAPAAVPGSGDPAHGVNGSQQGLLMRKLAVNHGGDVAVVNSSFAVGEASRIWLYRGNRQAGE
jgi:hypothetical protein